MRHLAALLLVWTLALSAVHADGPAAVTKAAYATAMAHFGFSAEIVTHLKPYLAPDLYAALLRKANQPVAKGDAPDIEGDVLLNAQDLPDKYTVGVPTLDGSKAHVPIDLRWGDEKLHYTVTLAQFHSAWKITQVDYGKDGKLTDLLK